MDSQQATMTKASRAGPTPLSCGLPEEIIVWEILVRLPPKTLFRCRAVCRAWRRATSTNAFLQAHHGHQPSLPIVVSFEYGTRRENICAFDHLSAGARLQSVAQLDDFFLHEASCDGLLILFKPGRADARFSVCNPATRQHAALRQLSGFVSLMGMYLHHPTGEYRLLLHRTIADKIGCYVYALGSDQPPRYIGGLELVASASLIRPALVRDNLHWYPLHHMCGPQQSRNRSKVVIVFDTTCESFRQMHAPVVSAESYVFKMDDTLGVYCYNNGMKIIDIWLLCDYQSEVWRYKCRVELPVIEMQEQFGRLNENWRVSVHTVHGDILLLVSHGGWVFHVDIDGKLIENFHHDGQYVNACQLMLKQTLVQHTFFTTLEDYDVNASPLAIE